VWKGRYACRYGKKQSSRKREVRKKTQILSKWKEDVYTLETEGGRHILAAASGGPQRTKTIKHERCYLPFPLVPFSQFLKMPKIFKPGKVCVLLQGRHAGKKVSRKREEQLLRD
jgi:hypothetical protein